MRPRHLVGVAVVVIALAAPAVASADPVVLRFTGGVDLAGTVDSTLRSVTRSGGPSDADAEVEELLTSMGGGASFEVPVNDYAAVGAGLTVTSWLTRGGDALGMGRNRWYDFDVILKGRYPLNRALRLYVSVPVGLSVNLFSEEAVAAAGMQLGHGLGWNLSLLLGAEFRFANGGSVFLETGWVHRQFTHQSAGDVFGTPADFELDNSVDQLGLHLGVGFELTRDMRVGLGGT